MTDDTNLPPEDDLEDDDTDLFQIAGVNSHLLFANPTNPAGPFHWIKNCVGASIYCKPGSQQPDDVKYLIAVGDGFELREITECYNAFSDKEYEPKKRNFKTVD